MKKRPQQPLVTAATTIIRHHNGVPAATEDETKERKKKFLNILDMATDKFMKNLEDGKVPIDSTLDLERIVKMVLVISGEADSIQGSTGTTQTETARISMSKIDEILNPEDPAVQAMFKQIYDGYNSLNDAENVRQEGGK